MHSAASVRAWTRPLADPLAQSAYAKGVLYALGAGVALGTLGPLSNVAYAAGMGSSTFAAMRAGIGALVLLIAIAWTRRPMPAIRALSTRDRGLLGLTAIAQASLSLSLFAAYHTMTVALVLAVYFCYPLLVSGISIALGRERMTAARGAGLVVALGGLLAVILGNGIANGGIVPLGLGLAALAAMCQATYLVVSRTGYSHMPSDQASTVILSGAAVILWLVAVPLDGGLTGVTSWMGSLSAWLAVLFAGIVGAAIAKVYMLRAVRRVGGTRASVLMLSEPLTGVILAAVLLGQGLSLQQALGGVGVLVGAVLAQRPANGPRDPMAGRRAA
jgi:DME family drug/metabolite transporter